MNDFFYSFSLYEMAFIKLGTDNSMRLKSKMFKVLFILPIDICHMCLSCCVI